MGLGTFPLKEGAGEPSYLLLQSLVTSEEMGGQGLFAPPMEHPIFFAGITQGLLMPLWSLSREEVRGSG